MDCGTAAMPVPAALFVIGVLVTTVVVARREGLGIKDTLLVMIGLRRFGQSRLVTSLLLITLLLPVGLWVALNEACKAGLAA
jgi:hypothetical protein